MDAEDLPASSERNIDTWKNEWAEKINITYWRNGAISEKNQHKYNRIGFITRWKESDSANITLG
jgi:hypothetical protein